MRGLLAILLVSVQVAGPWLCCCGPLAGWARVSPVTEATSESKSGPTCPHCRIVETKAPTDDGDSAGQQPKPNPEKCPYKGACWDALPGSVSASLDTTVFGDFAFANAFVMKELELHWAIPSASIEPHGTATLPFLTTETRLYIHHALRC